jgi:uncharacterized phage protein gp47/JayE
VSNFISTQYGFKLAGDVVIPVGSTRAYGRVEPNFSDNAYVAPVNSLTKHNFFSPAGVILFCNNPKEVYSNINSESDSNFRRRIIASIKSKAIGSAESVRFAALAVRGVRDVRIREGSYGIGSCDVVVVPETTSGLSNLPQNVLIAVNAVKPVGIKLNIRIAEKVTVSVGATIRIPMGVSETLSSGIKNQASLFIKRYLNSLTIGDSVSIKEIEAQINRSSDYIRSAIVSSLTADGKELSIQDFSLEGIKKYVSAGTVTINSVIMGSATY